MGGAVPPLPQYAFMAWCSVRGSTGTMCLSYFAHFENGVGTFPVKQPRNCNANVGTVTAKHFAWNSITWHRWNIFMSTAGYEQKDREIRRRTVWKNEGWEGEREWYRWKQATSVRRVRMERQRASAAGMTSTKSIHACKSDGLKWHNQTRNTDCTSIISVGFWRWCVSIERIVLLDFIHRLVSQEQTKLRN
jgi:hypothetical protein